jgi:hypothetical protein
MSIHRRRLVGGLLSVLAVACARGTMMVDAATRAHVARRASTCDLYASASCVDVSLPRRIAPDVTFVTRARVPGAIDVDAPRERGASFVFYVLATNDTRVALEKRREERRGGSGVEEIVRGVAATSVGSVSTSMKMRTFVNEEDDDDDDDASWTLVDAVMGMGDRAWVVFDACDDAWIGADADAFRFRLRTRVVDGFARDAVNASASNSRVAIIAATNHRRASASRRCARSARR